MIDTVKQLVAIVRELADLEGVSVDWCCYWCSKWDVPVAPHASNCLIARAQAALAASATLEARLVVLERLLGAVRERQAALADLDVDELDHDDAWWETVAGGSVRLFDSDKAIAAALAELDGEASG